MSKPPNRLRGRPSDIAQIRRSLRDARRILICMADHHLGNFALATPTLSGLVAHFGSRCDVLVPRQFARLAASLLPPGVRIIAHSAPRTTMGDVFGLLRTSTRITRRYDALIDFAGGSRSTVLALISGARTTITFDQYRWSALYRSRLESHAPDTMIGWYAQFLRLCDDPQPPCAPVVHRASSGERAACDAALRRLGVDDAEPFAVIHPGAGKSFRRWPVERFAGVADAIVTACGHRICIIAGPSDRELAEQMHAEMQHRHAAMIVALPTDQLLPLFDRAALLFCNESGPMHIAAFTSCPIVAVYGPTDKVKWAPVRTAPDVALLSGEPCEQTCRGSACTANRRCLTSVSLERAISESLRLIRQPQQGERVFAGQPS